MAKSSRNIVIPLYKHAESKDNEKKPPFKISNEIIFQKYVLFAKITFFSTYVHRKNWQTSTSVRLRRHIDTVDSAS